MITRFWLGRRRHGTTRADFSAHWYDVHARYGLALPGLRAYVQNHRLDASTVLTPPTFDGCSELDFDDVDAMREAFRSPEVAAADRDERRFADPDRFSVVVTERQVLLGAEVADSPARLLCFVRATPSCPRSALVETVASTAVDHARDAAAVRAELLVAIDDAPEPQACDLVVSLWFPTSSALMAAATGWAVVSSDALAGVVLGRETAVVHPRRLR